MCFPKPPQGNRGMISTAHCESGGRWTFPQMLFCPCPTFCPSPTISQTLGENRICFHKILYLGFILTQIHFLFWLSIRPSAITQSLLFDLAPFKSEAGASPLFTLQSDTVNSGECVCVSLGLCVCGARVSGGCLDIGVRLVWEDQSGSFPPPFPPSCRERKRESTSGILHKSFYWGTTVWKHSNETVVGVNFWIVDTSWERSWWLKC